MSNLNSQLAMSNTPTPLPIYSNEPTGLSDEEIKLLFQKLWDGDEAAAEAIFQGNIDWLSDLAGSLAEQTDIPRSDLCKAVVFGIKDAISKYEKLEFSFRPDERLQGGYAIWWVRLRLSRLAESHGYSYNAAANELTKK